MNLAEEFHPVPKPKHRPKRKTDAEYTKELRQHIHERDVYCRVCGGPGDQVHHVITRKRYRTHPERYNLRSVHDERNLMWVCWRCQDWAHASEANLQHAIQIQEQRFGPLRVEEVVT